MSLFIFISFFLFDLQFEITKIIIKKLKIDDFLRIYFCNLRTNEVTKKNTQRVHFNKKYVFHLHPGIDYILYIINNVAKQTNGIFCVFEVNYSFYIIHLYILGTY